MQTRIALLTLFLAGCAAPLQNGEIHVEAGAEERLTAMCRWHRADATSATMCFDEEPAEATDGEATQPPSEAAVEQKAGPTR
jgi:hypothetical protein